MKILILLLFLVGFGTAGNPPTTCAEVSQKATATLEKMDQALKIKTGMLLGEMQMGKQALEGCVSHNRMVETRASLLWFLTDLVFILTLILVVLHHRRMKKAILGLNARVHQGRPDHSPVYLPSQWAFRFLMVTLGLGFTLSNVVALFL